MWSHVPGFSYSIVIFSLNQQVQHYVSGFHSSYCKSYSIVQIYILHFAYPFPSQWTCGLFPPFSYYEHLCASLCVDKNFFNFLGRDPGAKNCWWYKYLCLTFFFKLAKLFSKVAGPFYIPSSNLWRVQISLNTHQWLLSSDCFFLFLATHWYVKQ